MNGMYSCHDCWVFDPENQPSTVRRLEAGETFTVVEVLTGRYIMGNPIVVDMVPCAKHEFTLGCAVQIIAPNYGGLNGIVTGAAGDRGRGPDIVEVSYWVPGDSGGLPHTDAFAPRNLRVLA